MATMSTALDNTAENGDKLAKYVYDFENVKDDILPCLIKAEGKEEYLASVPSVKFSCGLAATFFVPLMGGCKYVPGHKDTSPRAAIRVNNSCLEVWGKTVSDITKIAFANVTKEETLVKPLLDMIREIAGDHFTEEELEGTIPMYVLTSGDCYRGAAKMFDRVAMEEARAALGTDKMVVLPSSVHEVIVLPYTEGTDISELKGIVNEVNITQVAEEDQLSDDVYIYEDGRITRAA